MDEFSSLAEQRNRMMQALTVLQMPESIGNTNKNKNIWFAFILSC